MKKKFLAALLTIAMAASFTACGRSAESIDADSNTSAETGTEANTDSDTTAGTLEDATHIYVLTAPEDHGWTGSVATFAKEKVKKVNMRFV